MSVYDLHSPGAGDWLLGAVRRNPEALLLLGAGCAILLRNGRGPSRRQPASADAYPDAYPGSRHSAATGQAQSRLEEGVKRAGEYAAGVKDSVAEAAGSATDYAQQVARNVSRQSEQLVRGAGTSLQDGFSRAVREQPLLVAVTGLVVGAAVAAIFPRTEIEEQALSGAREAVAEAAHKARENLVEATEQAGQVLKERASERGLDAEGLKGLAREVAGTFTEAAGGESEKPGSTPGDAAKISSGSQQFAPSPGTVR
jgi:hypothetical protein